MIKNIKYNFQLREAASCKNIITEATKDIGQRDVKGDPKDFFIF